MAARRIETGRPIVAAFLLAYGLAVVWALLIMWGLATFGWFENRPDVTEHIVVRVDGSPLIEARTIEVGTSIALSRRTLDGKEAPIKGVRFLHETRLAQREPVPGVVRLPLPWNAGYRVAGNTDGGHPPTDWYLVRDDSAGRYAYFAGFDAISKLPTGFIGRNGFRVARPERDEQFTLPDTYHAQISTFMTGERDLFSWGIVYLHPQFDQSESMRYLTEADRLWAVDLRQRSARVVFEAPGLISTDLLTTRKEIAQQPAAGAKKADNEQSDLSDEIAVRTDDRIVLYDLATSSRRDFVLPKQLPNLNLVIYWVAPTQLLLQYEEGEWSGGHIEHLLWIDPSGAIQRQAEVKVAGSVSESPRKILSGMSGVIPISIAWLLGVSIGAPLVLFQNHLAGSYANGVAQSFSAAWPPLVFVLILSAAFAWVTLQLHRKYRRPATGAWVAFVLLMGLPGFIAYLVEHHRHKLEACPQCGEIVPRDRDACAACNTEFAPPPRVGTEIFA
jgi:hypothetical protein